ncbi:MAG: response regulator transcription factor, partial [Acetobacteraceae bacterium]|nr:response regulator transcription factor [Acetobacteraceae bacterium]
MEDDLALATELSRALKAQHYAVTHAPDGRTGLDLAHGGTFDVMVVDRMLPDLDGLTLVSRLRAEEVRTPVLFLTALSRVDERVRGLTAGGDDYLAKPFDMAELVARLEVIQRRGVPDGTATVLELGPLRLDLLERKAFRDGRDLALLPHEFRLLAFLVRQNGRLVTREVLLERVWNY